MTTRESLVVTDDGEIPFRAPQPGVAPTADDHLATKGWTVSQFAPASVDYIVKTASGSLSSERVLADSFSIVWEWGVSGQVSANLGDGVFPAVLGAAAGYFSALGHTHAAGDVASGTLATARLGSGSASGTTVLLGDSTWGAVPTGAIADDAVTDAKLRNSAALSVIGRSANSTGDPADIAAASDHQVLRRSGTAVGFGAVNLAQSAAVTGALPIANGGTGSTSASAARTALGAADASHSHTDLRDIVIDTSSMGGFLAGSGVTNLQDLVDFLDANLTPP